MAESNWQSTWKVKNSFRFSKREFTVTASVWPKVEIVFCNFIYGSITSTSKSYFLGLNFLNTRSQKKKKCCLIPVTNNLFIAGFFLVKYSFISVAVKESNEPKIIRFKNFSLLVSFKHTAHERLLSKHETRFSYITK